MRTKFFRTSAKCASASGAKCEYFSKPQAAKYFNIFIGSVCLAVHISQGLADTCKKELGEKYDNVSLVEWEDEV